jgi:hypothetical protein
MLRVGVTDGQGKRSPALENAISLPCVALLPGVMSSDEEQSAIPRITLPLHYSEEIQRGEEDDYRV